MSHECHNVAVPSVILSDAACVTPACTSTTHHRLGPPCKSHAPDKKYSVIHVMGYLKSWASNKELLEDDIDSDSDTCNLPCLVAVGLCTSRWWTAGVTGWAAARGACRITYSSSPSTPGNSFFVDLVYFPFEWLY